jgi:hypothetical protein
MGLVWERFPGVTNPGGGSPVDETNVSKNSIPIIEMYRIGIVAFTG